MITDKNLLGQNRLSPNVFLSTFPIEHILDELPYKKRILYLYKRDLKPIKLFIGPSFMTWVHVMCGNDTHYNKFVPLCTTMVLISDGCSEHDAHI